MLQTFCFLSHLLSHFPLFPSPSATTSLALQHWPLPLLPSPSPFPPSLSPFCPPLSAPQPHPSFFSPSPLKGVPIQRSWQCSPDRNHPSSPPVGFEPWRTVWRLSVRKLWHSLSFPWLLFWWAVLVCLSWGRMCLPVASDKVEDQSESSKNYSNNWLKLKCVKYGSVYLLMTLWPWQVSFCRVLTSVQRLRSNNKSREKPLSIIFFITSRPLWHSGMSFRSFTF